jgi:hypothetical protein
MVPKFQQLGKQSCLTNVLFYTRSQTSWVWLAAKLGELEMIGAGRRYEVILFSNIYVSLDFNLCSDIIR